jgi:amino acid adenylation domain-containing protein
MTNIPSGNILNTEHKNRYLYNTFNELFAEQCQISDSKIILQFGGEKYSARYINESANKLAWFLLKYNVSVEDRIGVVLDRSPDMLIALLAIMKAGAAYVPLDPEYPQERINYMLTDSSAKVLLTSQKHKGLFTDLVKEVFVEDFWSTSAKYSTESPGVKIDKNNLAYILYTSGSTGKPKGVQIEHHNLVNLLMSMKTFPGISPDDVFLAVTTISFDIAALELFLPLITGALLILTDAKVTRDGRTLLNLINAENVTMMQATPATYRMMIAAEWTSTPALKVLCCGEPMTNDLAGKLLARSGTVYNMYGPTETTIYSIGTQVINADEVITIGKPIANTEVYILNENNEQVAEGETGEICITGEGVARGYLNQPQLTAEKFIDNPFAPVGTAKLYRTGDLGKFLKNGDIQCFGRIDHQIKINGYRVELGEIEYNLSKQPSIKDVIVTVREDKLGSKYLAAYIIGDFNVDEISITDEILHWKENLRKVLPKFMIPNSFVILKEFPLTHNGKIDRNALPKPTEQAPTENAVLPETDIEKRIADIWRECVGVENITLTDDFFDIGGNSIIAVQIIIRLEKEFGLPLPLASLFEYNTIHKITNLVQNRVILAQSRCLVPIRASGTKVPLYIIHGGGLAVFCFKDIAQELDPEQPVFALQAMGVDGLEKPLDTVEAIAERYISEILEQNPDGPYALAGYSLGGVIAFEIVKQFRAMGKTVTTFAMFDSYAYAFESDKHSYASNTYTSKTQTFLFRVKHLLSILRENPSAFIKKLNNIMRYFLHKSVSLYNLNDTVSLEIYKVYEHAVFNYPITSFDGTLELFCSKNSIFYTKQDPIFLGWRSYVKTVRRHEIEGNHYSMFFKPNVEPFARLLQQALDNGTKNPLS